MWNLYLCDNKDEVYAYMLTTGKKNKLTSFFMSCISIK